MNEKQATDMNSNQTHESADANRDPLPWLIQNLRQKQVDEAAGKAEPVSPKAST